MGKTNLNEDSVVTIEDGSVSSIRTGLDADCRLRHVHEFVKDVQLQLDVGNGWLFDGAATFK
jgi:hypothetical protein